MGKKKGSSRQDDFEDDAEAIQPAAATAGGKKGKKGKKGHADDDFDADFQVPLDQVGEEEVLKAEDVGGKQSGKKGKKGKKGKRDDDFDADFQVPKEGTEAEAGEVDTLEVLADKDDEGEAASVSKGSDSNQSGKKGKTGKKGRGDDDFDADFQIPLEQPGEVEPSEHVAEASRPSGKKNKKHKKGRRIDDFDDDFKQEEDDDEASSTVTEKSWGGKSAKKAALDNGDSEGEGEEVADSHSKSAAGGGKKGKKGRKGRPGDDLDDDFRTEASEENLGEVQVLGRAKKEKKKQRGKVGDWSGDEEETAAKPAKPTLKKPAASLAFGRDDDEENFEVEEEENEASPVPLGKAGNGFAGLVAEEDDEEEDEAGVSTSGEGGAGAGHLLVGRILEVRPIPKSELKVCKVEVGSDEPVQIVCGGKNVRTGLLVITAKVGAAVPSSGIRVEKRAVKGVQSFGMLLSAVEMGWEEGADTVWELPADSKVGSMVPLERPEEEPGEEPPELVFSGKKKKKKKEEKEVDEVREDKEVDGRAGKLVETEMDAFVDADAGPADMFAGEEKKKKKKKKKGVDADVLVAEDAVLETAAAGATEEESADGATEPSPAIADKPLPGGVATEDGKKGKGKKEKAEEDDIDDLLAQLEAPKAEAEGAGKKKKKKKGKKEGEKDEDIDALLAELDGAQPGAAAAAAPAAPGPDGRPEPVHPVTAGQASAAGEDEAQEEEKEGASAAAKKKKKKKEKAKAKEKGEEAEVEEEAVTKKKPGADKKVPLHVRQMQERLAKLQAEEERQKKEEEERKRKEEEEAARLAEEERRKEEAKRLKKEREKEKLRKAKLEGKPVTEKQKAEARRLAAMREKLLLQGLDQEEDTAAAPPKRGKVVYDSKKKKKGAAATSPSEAALTPREEPSKAEEEEAEPMVVGTDKTVKLEEEGQAEGGPAPEAAKEVGGAAAEGVAKAEEPAAEPVEESEEEDDWDAKSWDDLDVEKNLKKQKAFEEVEPEQKPTAAQSTAAAAAQVKKQEAVKKPAKAPRAKKSAEDSDSESEEESETDSEESSDEDEDDVRKREAAARRKARMDAALMARSEDDLRSPICCILGHVDTGKTKLLDRIRNTNVQEGEAGGITQQIGATFFPMDAIKDRTKALHSDADLKVPGLLIIDTPGHESFTNLRSRGSGLCDIAILVIDIMHGLEPQTIESINLLKMRKTPFIIALNKVDRLYDWKETPNFPIRQALKKQQDHVVREFEKRVKEAAGGLMEQGLNAELYWKNKDLRKFVNIVPTSAISGEGIPDMLLLLVQLTQKMMSEKLMYISNVECTVLEVKVIEGLGTTIDVVLVNGVLHEGDTIVVCGLQGPIKTSIRALLTPHPMKELRVKGQYQHHKELKAAQGIKITAQGLESAVAGTQLHVVGPEDDAEVVMEEAMQDMNSILSRVDKSGEGVCVQASTLGSLEALLEFLKSPEVNIPVSGLNIGPVHKKDVMRASVMLERKKKEYSCILAFDVKVTAEAHTLAEELGVRIFTADIIYHLFDQFTAYMAAIKEDKRRESAEEAVFPCRLKILPNCIFNKKDPIVLGVEVVEGIARIGTPLCVPSKEFIDLGKIASLEVNHKTVESAKKGQAIAMKIQSSSPDEAQKMYGRHFDIEDELVSRISRKSIDLLKENYRDDLAKDDWQLVVKLKKVFDIQ